MKKIKYKSNEEKSALYNIETPYKAQSNVIKFFDDNSSMISEAKQKIINV